MRKTFIITSFFVYIFLVFSDTIFSRYGMIRGDMNLDLFSSYREAVYDLSINSWRDIILNIIMFIPLGVILPLCSKKFQNICLTLSIGIFFTLFIEFYQLIAKVGSFDFDDILNNFLGALLGYCIVMFILSLKKKDKSKGKYIVLYLLPILIVFAVFFSFYANYYMKEFGNIIVYSYNSSLYDTDISLSIELDDESISMPVYKEHEQINSYDTVRSLSDDSGNYYKVKDALIISKSEAYQDIVDGKFQLYYGNPKLKTLEITDVDIEYKQDTKGYYQPVYRFDCIANGKSNIIYVSAIK